MNNKFISDPYSVKFMELGFYHSPMVTVKDVSDFLRVLNSDDKRIKYACYMAGLTDKVLDKPEFKINEIIKR